MLRQTCLHACSVMQSLGELTTMYPSGGAFTSLADRFVDPAFGVAVGWNYVSARVYYLP